MPRMPIPYKIEPEDEFLICPCGEEATDEIINSRFFLCENCQGLQKYVVFLWLDDSKKAMFPEDYEKYSSKENYLGVMILKDMTDKAYEKFFNSDEYKLFSWEIVVEGSTWIKVLFKK
jgi:hypothetical protein